MGYYVRVSVCVNVVAILFVFLFHCFCILLALPDVSCCPPACGGPFGACCCCCCCCAIKLYVKASEAAELKIDVCFFGFGFFFTHESSRVAATRERVCAREREREMQRKIRTAFYNGVQRGNGERGSNI